MATWWDVSGRSLIVSIDEREVIARFSTSMSSKWSCVGFSMADKWIGRRKLSGGEESLGSG
jgi:hypothetical protein